MHQLNKAAFIILFSNVSTVNTGYLQKTLSSLPCVIFVFICFETCIFPTTFPLKFSSLKAIERRRYFLQILSLSRIIVFIRSIVTSE